MSADLVSDVLLQKFVEFFLNHLISKDKKKYQI